jgi:hypothetical protein
MDHVFQLQLKNSVHMARTLGKRVLFCERRGKRFLNDARRIVRLRDEQRIRRNAAKLRTCTY